MLSYSSLATLFNELKQIVEELLIQIEYSLIFSKVLIFFFALKRDPSASYIDSLFHQNYSVSTFDRDVILLL